MRAVLTCLLAVWIVACSDPQGRFCLDIERAVTVTVIDAQGWPLDSLQTRTVVQPTQAVVPTMDPNAAPIYESGRYQVVSDAHKEMLDPGPNVLEFAAWSDSLLGTATFVVEGNGCHVVKRDGPDTVVAF
jgi:hypothetical protein